LLVRLYAAWVGEGRTIGAALLTATMALAAKTETKRYCIVDIFTVR
jgi:hypothetical protein